MSKLDEILDDYELVVLNQQDERPLLDKHTDEKERFKALMLELIDGCEEFESDLGSEIVFDQDELRKRVKEL